MSKQYLISEEELNELFNIGYNAGVLGKSTSGAKDFLKSKTPVVKIKALYKEEEEIPDIDIYND